MNEEHYWRWQTRRVTVLTLVAAAAVVFGGPFAAALFDGVSRNNTASDFLATLEAGLALLVVVVFWYCARQNRAERALEALKDD